MFEAVQRLIGNAPVQVKGAEMLQTLINEEPLVGAKSRVLLFLVLLLSLLLLVAAVFVDFAMRT